MLFASRCDAGQGASVPQPHIRHDAYGTQLPVLTDAERQPRHAHQGNINRQREALRVFNAMLERAMVRGFYGHIEMHCYVQDGLLQGEMRQVSEQTYHARGDER